MLLLIDGQNIQEFFWVQKDWSCRPEVGKCMAIQLDWSCNEQESASNVLTLKISFLESSCGKAGCKEITKPIIQVLTCVWQAVCGEI